MFDFSRNYFELFGLPVGFVIDGQELASRYRELQKVVHPDRFAAAGEQSQRLALQSATMVNEAFATLCNPLQRARYLLSMRGVDVDRLGSLNDPEFLMRQMELREALDDVRNGDDPHARLDMLMRDISATIKSHVAQLAVQFEDNDPAHLDAAGQIIQKMQFLNKLLAEAETVEAELEEML